MTLDYNEVFEFMKEFEVDLLNRFNELIIDEPTNTYVSIKECQNMSDVKTYVVFALCRPISKGLDAQSSSRLLKRLNKYFNVNLTKEDCLVMYRELCYVGKLDEFKNFISRGFPVGELKEK